MCLCHATYMRISLISFQDCSRMRVFQFISREGTIPQTEINVTLVKRRCRRERVGSTKVMFQIAAADNGIG